MDLTSEIFTAILSPVAAFLPPSNPPPESISDNPPESPTTATTATTAITNLSSSNTIPSQPSPLPLPTARWHLHGVDPTGRRFFATPHFALGKPPLRIDVYLPPIEDYPPALRAAVKPEEAIYRRGKLAVSDLAVGRHLLGVLERWEREMGEGVLEGLWWGMPFGSCISVDFGDGGEGRGEVVLVPGYGVEQGMLGVEALKGMWGERVAWEGVEVVEWERLGFVRQVHEVISLVVVDGREVVFKSVLQEQRYMYNELKMLLSLKPHPNVVPRPLGVVTKKARFGNRRGVCGFLLEWYPLGSLSDRLSREDHGDTTSFAQRVRWATQVTQAFVHVNSHGPAGFYPDLKPDNIVLREGTETDMLDAVLIDLEQRGGWFAWSPPEVAYVEYLEVLVDESGMPEGDLKDEIMGQLREYYGDPGWSPGAVGQRYLNAEGGFSAPWLALLKEREAGGEQKDLLERAQVFMLGKLLWCIFEGQSLVRCGIDHELLRDADSGIESTKRQSAKAFPEFNQTPQALRQLIRACTAGAPEWEQGQSRMPGVVLRAGKLYPALSEDEFATMSREDTLDAARRFWHAEVERARTYIKEVLVLRGKPPQQQQQQNLSLDLLGQTRIRPLFSEVLEALKALKVG